MTNRLFNLGMGGSSCIWREGLPTAAPPAIVNTRLPLMKPDAQEIADIQTDLTRLWHEHAPAASGDGLTCLVTENHLRNFLLWHEEDIARRDDLGFERVFHAKRAIDSYNQQRNNFIEEMDAFLTAELNPDLTDCPMNSETPGMMIDRLSIMALKEFHMREETLRYDASPDHRENCSAKLARIIHQRDDLIRCLDELVAAVAARTRTFAVYYQFKMYNDPALNPQLYRK